MCDKEHDTPLGVDRGVRDNLGLVGEPSPPKPAVATQNLDDNDPFPECDKLDD